MRVLRRGMSGPDVRLWQEFLSRQGFGIGTADGSFGDRTLQATAEFQRRNGLGSDGVVGPGTVGKADELGFVEATDGGGSGGGGGGGLAAGGPPRPGGGAWRWGSLFEKGRGGERGRIEGAAACVKKKNTRT